MSCEPRDFSKYFVQYCHRYCTVNYAIMIYTIETHVATWFTTNIEKTAPHLYNFSAFVQMNFSFSYVCCIRHSIGGI